jgi:hypothetical protein
MVNILSRECWPWAARGQGGEGRSTSGHRGQGRGALGVYRGEPDAMTIQPPNSTVKCSDGVRRWPREGLTPSAAIWYYSA